jgi:uncharacterized coiled-coil protein SlyX
MTYWLLQFLPDWFFYSTLIIGVVGFFGTYVLTFVPLVTQYKLLIQVVSVLLLTIGVYYAGAISNNNAWEQKVSDLELKLAQANTASAEINALLIEELLNNQKNNVEINTLNKKYLDSIRIKINENCNIGKEVIDLHNSAAKNLGVK